LSGLKAVLFDFDDTILNSFPARVEAARSAAQGILEPGLDLDGIMREWAGRPQYEIWREFAGEEEEAQVLMDGYWKSYWDDSGVKAPLFPGVRGMLTGLKASELRLAIVTSKVRLLKDGHRSYGAVVELERVGLSETFDLVVGWEDTAESKPEPGPILFALERLGVTAAEAIMVGDSHVDITAAKRAGVSSAGATWGTVARDLLLDSKPDHLLDSPRDLLSLLS
jgi:pyrophosphatase PpaX